jgi:hypothetical protein
MDPKEWGDGVARSELDSSGLRQTVSHSSG